ncbi:M1 family metallopeptidase [Actinoplanes sp. LDG1-06]|uniref:Aminopeptidase N n=1 Tax=Paractinoplanes ovalisporus TaxID=2810368 RepID=A0ABS2AEX0_9ACTN|nr:M1 family metallopeptidase [Actinoplanes ovalisporus]MBM2618388.1 M1 family metallopeptidase [Actinoplanes ovalisporus]
MAWTTALLAVLLSGPVAPVPGAAGIGDPYYPDYGNGGYDVTHYDIRLRYQPSTDELSGTTTIQARATQGLSRFDLDFLLDVRSVVVDGRPARFTRRGDHELVVTPARPLRWGDTMTVRVTYSGMPSTKVGAGFTAWFRTPDGALAAGEPEEAWWWFPSNDHPADKARFDISVAVPDGVEVLSNGTLPRAPFPDGPGWTRWSWHSAHPMATYLAFLAIGQYDVERTRSAGGRPGIHAYSQLLTPELEAAARASVSRTSEIIDWESTVFGPYPFESEGGVVTPPGALPYSLETQTRPTYGTTHFRRGANLGVIVHENAHQWFGDSVSLTRWKDIWLNEGFATYAEWLWSEHTGEASAQQLFDELFDAFPDDDTVWTLPLGDPGVPVITPEIYFRGPMMLQELRVTMGDPAFFRLLKAWPAAHRDRNGDTAQFITLANRIAGRDLGAFFQAWLYTPSKPARVQAHFTGLPVASEAAHSVRSNPSR